LASTVATYGESEPMELLLLRQRSSKSSIKKSQIIEFQHDIMSQLKALGRDLIDPKLLLMYRSPLLTHSPHVHTTVRELLNLFEKPIDGSGIKRERLVYLDDKDIAYLSVRYNIGHDRASITADSLHLEIFFSI